MKGIPRANLISLKPVTTQANMVDLHQLTHFMKAQNLYYLSHGIVIRMRLIIHCFI